MTPFSRPSVFTVPNGSWPTLLDCLCEKFPAIDRERWLDRFQRQRILDDQRNSLRADQRCQVGMRVLYFREVPEERAIPFRETILYADEHLLVADKPHFLPVTPAGAYVRETLLSRLIQLSGNIDLSPIHRIDRHTAGLVLFSVNRETRGLFQALFRQHAIHKTYTALAPALPGIAFPLMRATRIERGEPFVLSHETEGAPNSQTHITVAERGETLWRYTLHPITGKKHQLRLHMAALGAPIVNDPMYPIYRPQAADDFSKPLQLLAQSLRFTHPLSGEICEFESRFQLAELAALNALG